MGVAAAVAVVSVALALPPLHVDGPYFKDARGGVVVLRGLNVAGNAKVPPFVGLTHASQLDALQRWGMNVMRLLFIWEAYEPEPGVYNEGYLDGLADLARAAESRGIYTIIDFHQDALARTLLGGCGEGFPAWAISRSVPQVAPDNGPQCSNWGMRMLLDGDLEKAWHGFYRDDETARQRFIAMGEHVAQRLRDVPGVLGYDALNEPMGDEKSEIGPLFADFGAALRRAHASALLFFSPHATVSAGLQSDLERPPLDNVVYAPHFYDTMVVGFQVWMGHLLLPAFHNMLSKAETWNAPLFLGEFGAPVRTWRVRAYMDTLFSHLDDSFISGTQWGYTPGWTEDAKDGWNQEDFSVVDGAGNIRANFKARPYTPRIAGTPMQFAVRDTTRQHSVELAWMHDPSLGETRVFVPHELLGEGRFTMTATGDALTCGVDGEWVTCTSPEPGQKNLRLQR